MNVYNLNVFVFIAILIASLVPFYLGYFLMLYGTSRNLTWSDVFCFKLVKKFSWSIQTASGFGIHLAGRIAPYLYILIYGQNMPEWIYIALYIVLILTIFAFLKKIFFDRRPADLRGVTIVRQDIVDAKNAPALWKIYNETFEPINKISPCRQSFDEAHFMEVLGDPSVHKYILSLKKNEAETMIGVALVTNDFKNLPWISWEYFQEHFPNEFAQKLIYYFIGLAIDRSQRGNSYSISLIEHIIDDIPQGGIMGFDHSRNINPMLHHFTRIVHQAKSIHRLHLDRQHYHIVRRK